MARLGLRDEEFDYLVNTVVRPLQEAGADVWCFGSRARQDNSPFSDVDLLVACEKNIDAKLGRIRETLEEGNFPFKVDIVLMQNLASAYRACILEERVLFERVS